MAEQSNQYTDHAKPEWRTCPHITVVKKQKWLRGGAGAFNVWRCSNCNLEFKPTLNKQ